MSTTSILRLEQLVLSRGKQRVAGPLDLDLKRGQRGLVTGPNGSGKTTLVLAIAGLLTPTAGQLERPSRIGLVPQEPDFPLHLRCADYLQQLLAFNKQQRRGNRAAIEALERFGLAPYAQRRIGDLSRGWRQRLNLARGWLGNPELLVLDEPQTALDPDGMANLAVALEQVPQTAILIVAPQGVGCHDLAPPVLTLAGSQP